MSKNQKPNNKGRNNKNQIRNGSDTTNNPLNVLMFSSDSAKKDLVGSSLDRLLGKKVSFSRCKTWDHSMDSAMTKLLNNHIDLFFFDIGFITSKETIRVIPDKIREITNTKEFVQAVYICDATNPILQGEDSHSELGLDGIVAIEPKKISNEDIDELISNELTKLDEWKKLVANIFIENGIENAEFLGKNVLPFEERKLADGRTIKNIAKVDIHYIMKGAKDSQRISVIRKHSRAESHDAELKAYNYINNFVPEAKKCFVTCYGEIPSETAIVLEYWNRKDGKLGDNTLERALKTYNKTIRQAYADQDLRKVEQIENARKEELIEVSRMLAHFHYFATKRIYDKLDKSKDEILETETSILQDNSNGEIFELKNWKKQDCQVKFIRDVKRILTYLNATVDKKERVSKTKLAASISELEKMLSEDEVFFAWTENSPFSVIANDIYGENLLKNSDFEVNNGEDSPTKHRQFQYKIVDPTHMALGPAILDFSFLGSPYIGFEKLRSGEIDDNSFAQRENLKRTCIREWHKEMIRLRDGDIMHVKSLDEDISKYDPDSLVRNDRTKEVYWHFKIAGDIIERGIGDTKREAEAQGALHTRLQFSDFTFKYLLECARADYDVQQIDSLRKIYDFFDKNIFQKMGGLNDSQSNGNR